MKVVLLAGGFGTRISEESQFRPKPMIEIGGRPILWHIMKEYSHYGFNDFIICAGYKQDYIKEYFATYPGVKQFLDRTVEEAKKNGYVTTMFGRRRPVPELSSSNFMQRSFGERVAMNSPIQGTAADIIKIAMIAVYRSLKEAGLKSKLILQIHDELVIETYPEEKDRVAQILKDEMQNAADLSVALEVDLHTGKNWYEAK